MEADFSSTFAGGEGDTVPPPPPGFTPPERDSVPTAESFTAAGETEPDTGPESATGTEPGGGERERQSDSADHGTANDGTIPAR